MSWIADGLLETAEQLLALDPRKPKQASLRRAVSSAYYALFHLLAGDGGEHLLKGPVASRHLLVRAFEHGEMKNACRAIAQGRVPVFGAITFPADMVLVAETFVDLQEARHRADYDVAAVFFRHDARQMVARVRAAFAAWRRSRRMGEAELFLILLLTFKKLNQR